MSQLLAALRESQDFQVIMDEMVKTRPVVQDYTPQKTMDETANLIEQIKHSSARRQGWDLLYQALTGKKP